LLYWYKSTNAGADSSHGSLLMTGRETYSSADVC
jgi:hypothetical protein